MPTVAQTKAALRSRGYSPETIVDALPAAGSARRDVTFTHVRANGTYTRYITDGVNWVPVDEQLPPVMPAMANLAAAPTAADFNALLQRLRDAGYLAV